MDRRLSYIDANPDILDLLLNSRFALEGDAKLAEAVFGQNTVVAGFTCAPTSPASMTVNIGPGMVYQMAALESAAISALNADTHQVLKQGLSREITPLTLVAPTTFGTAVNVLIEVAYVDDKSTTQQVFNYYNAANPDVPLTGVGGNNLPQTSVVKGVAQIQTKYGIPATSGSQTTPNPDPGFAPLFVVTLTQGQTAISGNIAIAAGAPFVADALQNIPSGVQTNRYTYVKDSGTVNAMVVTPKPAITSLTEGTELLVLPSFSNTAINPTLTVNGTSAIVLKRDGTGLSAGDIKAGVRFRVIFDGQYWRLNGMALSDIPVQSGGTLPTPLALAQAAGSPFNFKNVSSTTRTVASAQSPGGQITVLSGVPYTKKSATSNMVIVANFTSFAPVIPGQGNGATAVRLLASNGTFADVALNSVFLASNGAPSGSGSNSPTYVLAGIPAGPMTFGMSYSRGDNLAWTTIFNPSPADFGTSGTQQYSLFFIYEYEPSA